MMKVKTLSASVAAALMLGGAAGALAQEYYVIQPAPSERVVVQPAPSEGVVVRERVVTTPAQPVVAIPGERMSVSYTVDDPYPFPSPENHITQSGVFVPTEPAVTSSWADRNPNTD